MTVEDAMLTDNDDLRLRKIENGWLVEMLCTDGRSVYKTIHCSSMLEVMKLLCKPYLRERSSEVQINLYQKCPDGLTYNLTLD